MRKPLLFLIRFYQVALSPYLGRWCRFEPSCSEYARQALAVHGVGRGARLAVYRLARCHPFCRGGHDPVPPASPPANPFSPHAAGSPNRGPAATSAAS
ncbi:MAG: membrane protein insertion efficiency factor YidD [Verrucomicrobiae bacterium]|nr:membrane protein insertion efficiency factor YidD [Verrucomicrobiae bacterium]